MDAAKITQMVERYKATCVTRINFRVTQESDGWHVRAIVSYYDKNDTKFNSHLFFEQRSAVFADVGHVGVFIVGIADECTHYPANIEAKVKEQY